MEIATTPHDWPWDRALERRNLTVHREDGLAYVQFANGSWLCFDLVVDPTWRTEVDDPARVLPLAQAMLTWRSEHAERTLADLVLGPDGGGRWPPMPAGWARRDVRRVLLATVLALESAVARRLELIAKRRRRAFIALWGQFFVAAVIPPPLSGCNAARCPPRGGGGPLSQAP